MTPESIVLMPYYMLFPLPATSFLAQSFLGELLFTPFSNLSLKVICIIKPYLTPGLASDAILLCCHSALATILHLSTYVLTQL